MLAMLIVPDTKCFSSKAKVLTTFRQPKILKASHSTCRFHSLTYFVTGFTEVSNFTFSNQPGLRDEEDQLYPLCSTLPTLSKNYLSICSCKKSKAPCGCLTKNVYCISLCVFRGSWYGQPQY